jgi:TctA family transporter
MLEAALAALLQLFTPYYFLIFLAGVIIGLVVGIIPGMSGTVALALVLPFTMELDAGAALPFVIGLVSPILTSDSIPAILIGTPGAACAATVVDGYPMAQRGQAGRALGAAFTASAIGGVFGALLIALSIPVLQPLVLLLGTPEFLALSILAISAVAVLSGGNMLRGFAAACVGLLIGMIGRDPIRFVERWTFGVDYLIEPIHIIPVALGLFAVPEIVDLSLRRGQIAAVPKEAMQGRREGLRDTLKNWPLVLSASGLGAFVGFLPGLGSTVSTWLSYSWTVIVSKSKGGFGHGDVRGVIGPEAANTAGAGAALIPTIAFGVPGSTITALVLVVFWTVGITPGPKMLTEHVDMVFLIVWSVAIANLLAAAVCYMLTDKLALITQIPNGILAPIVLSVVVAGTLYSEGSLGGLVLLLLFGLLGWVMKRLTWPRPALLLAFILCPIIERFYFQSTMMYDNAWLARPAVIGILVAAVGIIAMGVALQRKANVAAMS